MKLLVTGGAGFIGSNFIRHILDNNKDTTVLNLDDLKYGSNPANLSCQEKDSRYTFFKGDISNFTLVSRLIRDADAIVHFAAETHVDEPKKMNPIFKS
jgi:dTDP-glucose 4,6-dehydratase